MLGHPNSFSCLKSNRTIFLSHQLYEFLSLKMRFWDFWGYKESLDLPLLISFNKISVAILVLIFLDVLAQRNHIETVPVLEKSVG